MRVALVSYDFGEYCIQLASALSKEAEVQLWLPENEAEPYLGLASPSLTVRTFVKPRLRQAFRQIKTTASLVREIHRFQPDVIHLQAGHLWFNCTLPLLKRYPLVVTVHDPIRHVGDRGAQNTPQWICDFSAYRASQVIVHAPQLKRALLERLRIPSHRVHVAPHIALQGNGKHHSPRPLERQDDHTILFFGRIWPYKGLEYLIQAEPLISDRVPELKIVIAGRGEDCDRYRRMMKHPERFDFYNEFVSDEQRAELFEQASVVALPYIEASQSGVIPLAYQYGKPVIATTVGGLPALVDHGQTGLLVPPRDTQSLADAAVLLLQNKDLRQRLGANAKRKLAAECSPEIVARQTMSVYREAVNGSNGR
jgi:glycosyltransferase involved in cell wall biosynthesis